MAQAPDAHQGVPGHRRGDGARAIAFGRADHERAGDLVRGDLVAHERAADAAVEQHDDLVGVLGELAEAVAHEHHRAAGLREHVHAPEQVRRLLVRQRRVRLVEQHDARIVRQRARDLGALLDRERALGERRVGDIEDRQVGEQLALALVDPVADETAALAPDHDVLGDRQVGEELRLLVHDGDQSRPDHRRPRLPLDDDLAGVGGRLAGQDLDHRALARAVRAGDAEDAPALGRQVELVERDRVAVVLAQAADLDTDRRCLAHAVLPVLRWLV